jgi:hypothetical protein
VRVYEIKANMLKNLHAGILRERKREREIERNEVVLRYANKPTSHTRQNGLNSFLPACVAEENSCH